MIVSKKEFIERVLRKLKEKLEESLPEQDFWFELMERYRRVLKKEVGNV